MRKTVFIVTLSALMFSASLWAQKIAPRCRTCGRKLTECQYKGHHPAKKVDHGSKRNNKPAKAHSQSSAPKPVQFPDGVYTGDLVNGVRHGFGTFKYNNGDFYDGSWRNNERRYGMCKFRTGEVYDGDWSNDTYMENGYGTYTNTSGCQYRGTWKDGRLNGGVRYIDINEGDTVFGEYIKGHLNGYCYKRLKGGERIMSMVEDDISNGFHIDDERDGSVSYCYMNHGLEYGPFIVIKPDNTVSCMVYDRQRKIVCSNTHKKQDVKQTYQTYYDLGDPDLSAIRTKQDDTRFGEIIWSNGDIYVGDLRYGAPHGYGFYVWSNKDAYLGYWANGKREGEGAKIEFNEGNCIYGLWHDDDISNTYTHVVIEYIYFRKVDVYKYKDGKKVQ